jgi:WD40 repeat protein
MLTEVTPLQYEEYLDLAPSAWDVRDEDELVRLYENILAAGPGLDLFAMVAALVATRRTPALRRLHADSTALHKALGEAPGSRSGAEFARRLGPPFLVDESSAVHALRVLAGLGLALAEDEPGPDLLRAALNWYREAHGAPEDVVAPWSPATLAGQDERLRRCLQRLADAAGADRDSLATLTAAATLRCLRRPTVSPRADILLNETSPDTGGLVPAGHRLLSRRFRLTQPARRHAIKALLDEGTAGTDARLTVSVDRAMPAGLIPDPERMSLFTADESFQNALGRAWRLAGQGRIRGLVTWCAIAEAGPVRYIDGESAGAAFAVVIDEARRLARPIAALAVVRRLVSGNAVVGRIDDLGYLHGVEGYETKLSALRENARVIVPAADVERANQAKVGHQGKDKEFEIEIVPAAHWKDAAWKARRTSTKVLLSRGVALVLVGALIATGTVALSQHRAATMAARIAASVQLARVSETLDHADPITAAGLAAAAWQEAPTSQARVSLQASLAQPLRAVLTHGGPFKWVGFSPDRGGVLAAVGNSIRLWNATTDRPLGTPVAVPGGAVFAAFSPNGSVLATADGDGTVRRWDIATGRQIGAPLEVSALGGVNAVAFSPSGSVLATADGDGTARLWDLATARQIGTALPAGNAVAAGGQVTDVAFSPDGAKLATASLDGTARLWDIATHRQVGAAMTNGNVISGLRDMRHVAFSPDGATLATVSADHIVRLWSVSTQRETASAGAPHEVAVDVAFGRAFGLAGALLVIGDSDGIADLWDPVTKRTITSLDGEPAGSMLSVAASPDGSAVASVGADGTASVWDVSLFHAIGSSIQSEKFSIEAVSPDGRTLATAEFNRTIGLWDLATGRQTRPPIRVGGDGGVAALAFSRNGQFLAAGGGDGSVRLWNVTTGRLVGAVLQIGGNGGVAALAFSRNGRFLAAGGGDGSVRLWNLTTGRPSGPSFTVDDEVTALVFSPDGNTLATVTKHGSARFWDTGTGHPVTGLRTFTGVQALAFSPDGTVLATAGDDGEARLWNPATGREIGDPMGGSLIYSVNGVAFSPDGTLLATAGGDGDARIFDVATSNEIGPSMEAANTSSGLQNVTFSADGTTLATFGPSEAATAWDVALPADLFNVACSIASQPLTQQAWDSYAPTIPYIRVC